MNRVQTSKQRTMKQKRHYSYVQSYVNKPSLEFSWLHLMLPLLSLTETPHHPFRIKLLLISLFLMYFSRFWENNLFLVSKILLLADNMKYIIIRLYWISSLTKYDLHPHFFNPLCRYSFLTFISRSNTFICSLVFI